MGKFNRPKIPLNLKLAKVSLLKVIAIIQYLWKIIFGPRRMNFMGENLVLKLKFCKFEVHYVNLQNAKANFVSANQKLNNPTNNNKE